MKRGPLSLPLPLLLAWRYLRGRQSRLLHRTALAALFSVALGVSAMVIAMALMSGYRSDLESKLIAGNAAVLVYPLDPGAVGDGEALAARLKESVGEVTRVDRVAYGQGTVVSADRPDGEVVTLRGVSARADPLAGSDPPADHGADGVAEVVLGDELARRLEVGDGDLVRLVVLGFDAGQPRFRYQSVRVRGTFHTGFAEFDRSWAAVARPLVERLVGTSGGTSVFEVTLEDPSRAPEVAASIDEALGSGYLVTDWQELNRDLFSALALQQLLLFFLLGLIVLVSTFNVASTLMVLVRERMRDVGVLAALGLDRRRLGAVFVAYGGVLGLAGTAVGVGVGWAVSWAMTTFEVIRFDPEVAAIYFISSVPFRVRPTDVAAIVAFSLTVTLVSSLTPAWRVGRVAAADALRYE